MNDHAELGQKFIETFEVVAVNLETDPGALKPLYAKLPARFPSLYEHLVQDCYNKS